MSFDFNSIGSNFKPKVESTFLGKGGGGGNTGYFQQKKKDEKEEEKPIMQNYLSEDKLEKMADEGLEEIEAKKDGLLDKFKNFLGKLG